MKTESYTDGEGQTRYYFVSTAKENFQYDSAMEAQGLGRVVDWTPEGRKIEFWKPKNMLRQTAWKVYAWVDEDGNHIRERLPVYVEVARHG